jgi:hypothetical protein
MRVSVSSVVQAEWVFKIDLDTYPHWGSIRQMLSAPTITTGQLHLAGRAHPSIGIGSLSRCPGGELYGL